MLLLTSKKISMGRKIDISKSVTNWEWSNKLRLLVWKTLGAWWQEKEWAFCSRCLVNLSSLSSYQPFSVSISFSISSGNKLLSLFTMSHLCKSTNSHGVGEKKITSSWNIIVVTHTHTHCQVCSSMLVLQIMPALLWHNRHNCAKKIIKHNSSIKNNLYEIVPFAELKGHYLISIGRIERPLFHNPLMLYLYFTVFVNLTGAYVRNIFNL